MKSKLIILLIFITTIITPKTFALNRVLSLNGDGDYVEIKESESLNAINSQVTVEAWIKPTVVTYPWMPIIYKGDEFAPGHTNRSYSLFWGQNGVLYLCSAPNGRGQIDLQTPDQLIALEEWYHIAGVIDGKNGFMRILINGAEVASRDFNGDIYVSMLPLRIGRTHEEEEFPDYSTFSGLIDEVRIWNIARTQRQIQATMDTTLTGKEEGLTGYWSFDDGTANDLSPNGNDGTLYGDARYVEDELPKPSITTSSVWPVNRVLSLDGDGDYMEIPCSASLSITDTMTVEAWVQRREELSGGHVVGKGEAFFLWIRDECANFDIRPTNSWWKSPFDMNSKGRAPVFPSEWHHLAGSFDGSNVRVYLDGQLVNYTPYEGNIIDIQANNNPIMIGMIAYEGPINGLVDEVRIWNTARTQRQIRATMNTTLTGQEDGLVSYWNFDDGTASDTSENGNDGILYGDAEIVAESLPYDFIHIPKSKVNMAELHTVQKRDTLEFWVQYAKSLKAQLILEVRNRKSLETKLEKLEKQVAEHQGLILELLKKTK